MTRFISHSNHTTNAIGYACRLIDRMMLYFKFKSAQIKSEIEYKKHTPKQHKTALDCNQVIKYSSTLIRH